MEHKNKLHEAYVVFVFFTLQTVLTVISIFFMHPDEWVEENGALHIPDVLIDLGLMTTAMLICGASMMAIKLADERKTLPSAGFTILAISTGIFFVTSFEMENINKATHIFMGGMMLYLPAMLLIFFYSDFPKWLNWSGVVACLPQTLSSIWWMATREHNARMDLLSNIGYTFIIITCQSWAVIVMKHARKPYPKAVSEQQN